MANDLEFRQQRIAVIARRVHRIASVGELRPQRIGKEFVLRHCRPVAVAPGMMFVGAVDFLQKHHIGGYAAHRFTQFRQDETPVQRGKTLVRVDRQHGEAAHGGHGWRLVIDGTERLGPIHGSTPSAAGSPGAVARFLSR